LALTNPSLFSAIRNAGTKAYPSGIMSLLGLRAEALDPKPNAEADFGLRGS
jgi:hypothetical protein